MSDLNFPPGPKMTLNLGIFGLFRRDPIRFFFQMSRYGPISHTKLFGVDVYLLNDPDMIRDVLVTEAKNFHKSRGLRLARIILGNGLLTSEDDFHLRQRRLAAPAFQHKKITAYARTMVEYAAQTSERWQPGQQVDMSKEMMRLTLAIAGKTLFDADVSGEADEIGLALTNAMHLFLRTSSPLYPVLARLPLPSNRRYALAQKRLDQTVYRMIAEHHSGAGREDLLGMMLAAQDVEGGSGSMTDLQLRDESMTIFLAGHETTAVATTWTWYLLAQHPKVQEELRAELRRVLGGRLPSFEDLPRLVYTRQVLTEAMRLYPPVYVIGREPVRDVQVGGYTLPAGSSVFMSQYVMHRNPRFYPDPERFDPQRWTAEEEASRPKFAYFPFGGGPRVCIGEQFAWTEGVLVLATLAQRWMPRLAGKRAVGLQPMITLRPQGGMPMVLEEAA